MGLQGDCARLCGLFIKRAQEEPHQRDTTRIIREARDLLL